VAVAATVVVAVEVVRATSKESLLDDPPAQRRRVL